MAKIKIFDRELYYDTTDDGIYELRPDGTYQKTHSGGAALVTDTMRSAAFASGTLGSTSLVVAMAGAPLPCTVILDSSDGTRKIQWSADGDVEYFDFIYDRTNANELVVFLDYPVTHIKFTGNAADTYRIG